MKQVIDIVEEWLKENNYDGLFSCYECACEIGDLFPCGNEGVERCSAGHKVSPSEAAGRGYGEDWEDSDHEWVMIQGPRDE